MDFDHSVASEENKRLFKRRKELGKRMNIAITWGTGFVGRELVSQLVAKGHRLKCWFRNESNRELADELLLDRGPAIQWVKGELGDAQTANELVTGCDAVVHAHFGELWIRFAGEESM